LFFIADVGIYVFTVLFPALVPNLGTINALFTSCAFPAKKMKKAQRRRIF
jgi:hypothetical protein